VTPEVEYAGLWDSFNTFVDRYFLDSSSLCDWSSFVLLVVRSGEGVCPWVQFPQILVARRMLV